MELVDLVPLRFKVDAADDVEKFVLSAMPGMRLVHAPQVPAAVPVRPDTYYFSCDPKGQMYECMLQAQLSSIYEPSGLRFHNLMLDKRSYMEREIAAMSGSKNIPETLTNIEYIKKGAKELGRSFNDARHKFTSDYR